MATPAKKTRGRQKVEMVRMEKSSNLQVTFSKRRCGLFKKASELCTLCGVQVAIIVFSPGKKLYSFGHPSVETIINRFDPSKLPSSSNPNTNHLADAQRRVNVCDLNLEITLQNHLLEIEKKRNEEMNEVKKAKEQANNYLWDQPTEKLTLEGLKHLKASLEELKKKANPYHRGYNSYKPIKLEPGESSNAASHLPILGIGYPMLRDYDGALYDPNGFFIGYEHYFY